MDFSPNIISQLCAKDCSSGVPGLESSITDQTIKRSVEILYQDHSALSISMNLCPAVVACYKHASDFPVCVSRLCSTHKFVYKVGRQPRRNRFAITRCQAFSKEKLKNLLSQSSPQQVDLISTRVPSVLPQASRKLSTLVLKLH